MILEMDSLNTIDWESRVNAVALKGNLSPFHPCLVEFASELSKRILLDSRCLAFPELMALGYWLRKGQILDYKKRFQKSSGENILLPRGLVVHFTPANVDTIFVYSWIISLLVGNRNLIRVSKRLGDQVSFLMMLIHELLREDAFVFIQERTLFLSYGHDDAITQTLSRLANVRAIWGGDQTIQHIRSFPIAPLATEVVFADRFSLAVICAKAVISSSKTDLINLVKEFSNDAFWYGQATCSSPKLIVWIGSESEILRSKELFWAEFQKYLEKHKKTEIELIKAAQITNVFSLTSSNENTRKIGEWEAPFQRLEIDDLDVSIRNQHRGGGVFLELTRKSLQELKSFVTEKDQTIGSYGFSRKEWISVLEQLPMRGIDRIVPIGQMLHFHPVWDGFNLFTSLTREVHIGVQ